jgi:hypothetical protein
MDKSYTNQLYLNELKKANEILGIKDDLSVLNNKHLVFIYTPPKVGSTTLVSTIRLNACGKYTVLHLHCEKILRIIYSIHNLSILEIINYNKFLGKNVYVIDIYRSPIEHKISSYFENIVSFHFNTPIDNLKLHNVDKICNRFNCIFPYLLTPDYFRKQYEIEYPITFDFNKKFLHVEKGGVNYYKLRLKDVSEWRQILQSIFGIEMFIINDYETDKKSINETYNIFKQHYTIPINLFNLIESDKDLLYYYSNEERIEYLNLWRNKINNTIFKSYTQDEYNLYNNISSDNQYINEIHNNHYLDYGCLCYGCSRKRGKILVKLQKGEHVDTRIVHSEATREYLNEQTRKIPIYISYPKLKKKRIFYQPL